MSDDDQETPPSRPDPLRRKELVDRVAARTGLKKGEARTAAEAVLRILGDALAEGRGATLPPLGKLRVQKQRSASGRTVTVLKLHRAAASEPTE